MDPKSCTDTGSNTGILSKWLIRNNDWCMVSMTEESWLDSWQKKGTSLSLQASRLVLGPVQPPVQRIPMTIHGAKVAEA
jgi:hypothetical protein